MRINKPVSGIIIVSLFLFLITPAAEAAGAREKKKTNDKPAAPQSSEAKTTKNNSADFYKALELFSDALTAVQHDYVEKLSAEKIMYGALKGLLSNLDPYSQFMEPDLFKELQVETEGQFGGIGIEITIRDNLLTIITPLDETPAAKAGLKAMDRIVRIDGKITRDITLTEAVKKMRGKPGTTVTLGILRESSSELMDVVITRDIIKIRAVRDAMILDNHIAYIKLTDFSEKTKKDLDAALADLETKNMDSLILDLRNNPGGLLVASVETVSEFLPAGELIVSTKGRDPSQNTEYRSAGKTRYKDIPLIVMVNGGSASASEIVAGAIQDHKRGVILGNKTFGKGSVQTVIPLRDSSALRLTTAKYYTPSGRTIHEKGITPDVLVDAQVPEEKKNTDKSNTLKPNTDVFEKIEQEQNNGLKKNPAPEANPPAPEMSTPQSNGATAPDKQQEPAQPTAGEAPTINPEAEKLLKDDNQLREALNLMRGIKIFREMTRGTGAR
ncbi:MAG: S41 family peptidase [Candidatus Omnitrophica bacterium]|nr:S41 family peptidase [Candidatus Omnitrophota bacterium]